MSGAPLPQSGSVYPTRAAVLLTAAGMPFTLLVALFLPGRWYAGLAWPVAVLLLTLADAVLGTRPARAEASLPPTVGVGEEAELRVLVAVDGPRPPAAAQLAVAVSAIASVEDDGRATVPLDGGRGAVLLPLRTLRRGYLRVEDLWLRWRGLLGLCWHQRRIATGAGVAVLPDIRAVEERGARLFQRYAASGLLAQHDRGDGSDFDAMVEYRSGMDRRAIDWKHSARHGKLHAKEFRAERNAQIVFAVDSGRQMVEPVAGLPRVDRAVSAALLCAWIALKLGDRVALHAFDSRPRVGSGLVSGARAFPALQQLAAEVDYSGEETNYTFALTTLAARLHRRSMIVLFTEFTDPTSADFLVRAAARVVATHLLLVVVLRDEELEAVLDDAPRAVEDVTRAVTAAGLLRDRQLALARLQRLGVHVIESEHDKVGERLVAGYVDLKKRNLL